MTLSFTTYRLGSWMAGMLVLGLVAMTALSGYAQGKGQGQGNEESDGKGKGKDKPSIDDRPVVEPRNNPSDDQINGKGKGLPEKPDRPDKANPSTPVKELVTKFQEARDAYLEERNKLNLALRNATEEERAAIRKQMRELLDELKEQHKQFQQEMKDRAQEMKQELHDDLGRVVNDGVGDEHGKGRGR